MASVNDVATTAPTLQVRRQAARRARAQLWNRLAIGMLTSAAGIIAVVLLFIVIYTIVQGVPNIGAAGFFTSGDVNVGIGPQIFNTFYLLLLAMVFMIPIGIGAAIYMVEYAQQGRLLSVLRFATETLTSLPSIVIGLLGFFLFVTNFGDGTRWGYSRLAGAVALAVLNLPWMLRTAEDALRAVPNGYREASLAMGATRFQTIWRVVLPAALPGLVTGILIVAGRVTGESAALLFTAGEGVASTGWFNLNPFIGGETLAVHIYSLFAENPTAQADRIRLGTAFVLIVLVLVMNLSARLLGGLINRRLTGTST